MQACQHICISTGFFYPTSLQGSKNKKFQKTSHELYKHKYSLFPQNQIIAFEMGTGN